MSQGAAAQAQTNKTADVATVSGLETGVALPC